MREPPSFERSWHPADFRTGPAFAGLDGDGVWEHNAFPTRQQPPYRAPTGHRAQLQELAHRGGDADADEQSRSRRRRGARGAGRLWRHRPGGARLGELRQDRRDAEAARGRRDPARPVGQAGRRVPDPCGCAARADRQFQPGAALGDLGPFQRIRSQGADDVRPDDGRLLDLYRHPGHRSGHLRDLRRNGPPALWRRPARPLDPDRGPRRHGRRAAAGGGDGRRALHRHRMPGEPDREAAGDPLSRQARDQHRRGAGHAARKRRCRSRSACSAMRRRSCPKW